MRPGEGLVLGGERFTVTYRVAGDRELAYARTRDICFEQTVEFPEELVPEGPISNQIVGQIESFTARPDGAWEAVVSYANETAGDDLLQLLNVVFGNISIKPGIRLERMDLSEGLLKHFRGPRFGQQGLRDLLHEPTRPLLCTGIKPMGLSIRELADLAFKLALGGIDIIKDDHGLANQVFCPFEERVQRCAEAVRRANAKTGYHSIYMPNVTAAADQVMKNAYFARQAGAEAMLLIAGLTGFDTMRMLSDDDALGLPILNHPSFNGTYVLSPESGMSHYALYGQIARLSGADANIFTIFGGRFGFSREDCQSIMAGTRDSMGHIAPIFPTVGGGMSVKRVPEVIEMYGRDEIFLIGGDLHKIGPDVIENCHRFRTLAETYS